MATASNPVAGPSRRWFLRAAAAFTAVLAPWRSQASAQGPAARLGAPVSPYGSRSRFERALRLLPTTRTPEATASFTPLRDSYGIITPSSLHFERHHAGVPDIDPAAHTLTIHGLVDRPLVVSIDELKRLPSASRILFIECSGNSSSEWLGAGAPGVQLTHGLTSCCEWTGVWLSTLLGECGVRPGGTWILAEGADAARMARSLPMAKAMDDVLLAFAQNGEPLRPEQGYPLRLIAPGWEGNVNVKWLRRVEVLDRPAMTRWETAKYTDLMPDGTARQFTFEMDAKSVITRPSGGETLPRPGVYEITGLAWSGRGAIARVDVTTDGGQTWLAAELQAPVLPRAHTRFRWSWTWNGREALLASRSEDDTGYVQPTRPALVALRGANSGYHQNGIQAWRVAANGAVTNGNA
jgi:sulfane dehydrogenase subunit SoxC